MKTKEYYLLEKQKELEKRESEEHGYYWTGFIGGIIAVSFTIWTYLDFPILLKRLSLQNQLEFSQYKNYALIGGSIFTILFFLTGFYHFFISIKKTRKELKEVREKLATE